MSAVAGLWRFDNRPDPGVDCLRMLAAEEIYGPHDGRMWSDGPVALGRRLYRRLPEDVHDRQPLSTRDGRLTLVADIRIDNRDELISALGMTRSDAAQMCDAAILLTSLDRWGDRVLDRLVGDFAFALWDAHAQTLTLARDFQGHAPLHYHRGRGFFAFASMPKGLHALADIPRAPDEDAVAAFVARIPQMTSRSYFAGIERVLPGHIVTVTRDGVSSRCYWQPRRPSGQRRSTSDYVEGLRFHLDQATQARLRGAGGTVGTHLSAGLDSAGVTATAARLLAPTGGKVVAFTAVPRDGDTASERPKRLADEGPLAAATAALYGNLEHVLIRSGHVSPLAGLDRSIFLCDRPIQSPVNWVWTQAINEAAKAHAINVVLTGQLGNATLSYKGFELLPELLRRGHLRRLWHEASALVAKGEMTWRGVLSLTFGPFAPAWRRSGSGRPRRDGFDLRLTMMNQADIGNYNKGVLGGNGVDLRDPTADKRLVEYCLSTPTDQYLAEGVPRAFAKRALADRLPRAVLNERRKGYQAADWHVGLSAARLEIGEEVARLAASDAATRTLDIERLQRLVDNWPDTGWERDDTVRSYRLTLLRGISAGLFLRIVSGENQ